MDQPGLPVNHHAQALAGLARLNWLSRSSRILWPPLRKLAGSSAAKPIRVLDVACGGGDVTIALSRRFQRLGYPIVLAGCDKSETALEVARAAARRAGQTITFFQTDILNEDIPSGYDAIICSLFLHHLDEAQAEALLRQMAAAAGRLVLVNDLVRSRRGYFLAWLSSRLLTRSAIVHYDAPLSVAGAFTRSEAMDIAARAGLARATVTKHWPERFLLQWWKP